MDPNILNINQLKENNTLSYYPKPMKHRQKQMKELRATPIYKSPVLDNKYYIFGDIIISADRSATLTFEECVSLSNNYRPVVEVKREVGINYLRMKLDCTTSGMKDFNYLIPMLRSMQDNRMYTLSNFLEEFQIIINQDQRLQNFSNNQQNTLQKKQRFQELQNTVIPELLQYEASQNPQGLQFYFVFDSKNSLLDSRTAEYGINQNLLNVIGTDIQEMEEFILRVGWFEATWFNDTDSLIFFLKQYMDFLKFGQGLQFFGQVEYQFQTLDEVLLQAVFQPKVYYLLNDENTKYTINLNHDQADKVIGFFIIFNIDIDIHSIKKLIGFRKSKFNEQNNKLLLELSENTLSQFQYETQTNYFFKKFYSPPDQPNEKTCKYRVI